MKKIHLKKNNWQRCLGWGLVIFTMLLVTASSYGCTVCFGKSDAPIMKGLEVSVLFMVGVTYTLIFGGVAAVILLRRRAHSDQQQAE